MTIRPKALMQAAGVLLFLVLVPGIARAQEQKEPATPQQEKTQEKTNEEPSQQKPGALLIPEGKTSTDSEDQQTEGETLSKEGKAAPRKGAAEQYIIKKGDTLWDISNAFLKDPFLWPFIWKANLYITNPDLIYPGNKLEVPSLAPIERALETPTEEKEEVEAKEKVVEKPAGPKEGIASAGVKKPKPVLPETAEEAPAASKLILPEELPVPIMDKYAMLSAGFVNQEETNDKIIGSFEESKSIYAYDDIVYVKIRSPEKVNIGDKFLIYMPLDLVKHPKTKQRFGRLIKGLGILQITAKDSPDMLTARVTLSFDAIEKNSLITPYQEPALVYNTPEKKKVKDIAGYILAVTDNRTITGQTDIVYLDKGSAEGVEPGDSFIVYADPDKRAFPKKRVGEVQVFLVKDHSSTAVVRKSIDALERGDAVTFKK